MRRFGKAVIVALLATPCQSAENSKIGTRHGLAGAWTGIERCIAGCKDYNAEPTMRLVFSSNRTLNGTYERLGVTGWEVQSTAVITTVSPGSEMMIAGDLYHIQHGSFWGSFILQGNGTATYGAWTSAGSERLFRWDFKLSGPSPSPPSSPFRMTRVYKAGEGNYSCHRVPSVVTLPGDVVLVFAESRRPNCLDNSPKDVTMKRSIDGGKTFGPLSRVLGNTIVSLDSYTYRNPFPTVVTGATTKVPTVVLNAVNSTIADGTWPSLQLKSTDGGLTFSEPEPVASLNQNAVVEGVLGGPGFGIELGQHSKSSPRPGRILSCGATGYHPGHAMEAIVWYSDNEGDSWNISTTPLKNMQECQLAELSNGSVVINMRNSHLNPCDCRAVSISHDGGESWTVPWYIPDLVEPVCSAGFINTGITNNELYFSNPNSTNKRAQMTIKYSGDSGATWNSGALVWAEAAAYSVLTELNSTTLGLVFEHGISSPYEAISIAFVPKASVRDRQ